MEMKKAIPAWFQPVFFLVILVTALLLTCNFHKGKGYFNWRSEIWTDRAGYYIYLPATLYYHWDLKQCPPEMDGKTGYGFTYDYPNNKIYTKYTYGVAFLLSPFFVAVHYITKISGMPQDWAFAPIYHHMVDVGAVVYMVLGLFLLFRFLRMYFRELTSYLTVLLLFAGTNLFYYSIVDTLMSHVYSFFLIALFLYCLKLYLGNPSKYLFFIIASLAVSFAILIRPTSMVILPVFLLLDVRNRDDLAKRLKFILRPGRLLGFLLILFLVWVPQFLYDHYLTGRYFCFTYGNEAFANLLAPRLPEVWLSTLNGLFTYTPMLILFIAGMIMMIRRNAANGWLCLLFFLGISYVFSSWWCWYFGCSFGQRSYIEYFPLLSLPFAFLIENTGFRRKKVRAACITLLILLFSWFNINLSYAYEECFFGSVWDWNQYTRLLYKANLWPVKPFFSYRNDFENMAMNNGGKTTPLVSRSGDNSLLFNPSLEFNSTFFEYPANLAGDSAVRKLKVNLYVFKTSRSATGAFLVCDIKKDGKQILYESRPLDVPMARARQWYAVPANFDIPKDMDPWAELRVYIWNRARTTFYVDDLEINSD